MNLIGFLIEFGCKSLIKILVLNIKYRIPISDILPDQLDVIRHEINFPGNPHHLKS